MKYTSELAFELKGLLYTTIGFLMQKEFKSQTHGHMQGFKCFAEGNR